MSNEICEIIISNIGYSLLYVLVHSPFQPWVNGFYHLCVLSQRQNISDGDIIQNSNYPDFSVNFGNWVIEAISTFYLLII